VVAALEEAVASAELLEQARAMLAAGRAEEAEQVAARAVELAPGAESARALLAEAEALLSARLRRDLLEPPLVARLRVKPADIATLRLSSADKYLLSRCDGRRTVRQLVQIAPLRELEVLKALRRFADGEVVELVTPG
jgi:hypothetical protein